MFPPSHVLRPPAWRMAAIMAAVVDFPLEPVTPIAVAGQACRKRSISVVSRAPFSRAIASQGFWGRTAGIDHDEIGLAEIFLAVPTEVEGGDFGIGETLQRGREGFFVCQIGHGDDRTLRCEPAGRSRPAAEMTQSHDGCSLSVVVHKEFLAVVDTYPGARYDLFVGQGRALQDIYYTGILWMTTLQFCSPVHPLRRVSVGCWISRAR